MPAWFDPDEPAEVARTLTIELDRLRPQVALPGAVHTVLDLEELDPVHVDVVYVGTCTNGRHEDLKAVARLLKGQRVAHGLRLIVVPASRKVLEAALADGTVSTLVESGATLGPPGCGACIGRHMGVLAPGEVVCLHRQPQLQGTHGLRGGLDLPHVTRSRGTGRVDGNPGFRKPQHRAAGSTRMKLENRLWKFGDDINTDQIVPGRHAPYMTSEEELPGFAFIEARPEFAKGARAGDILVAGTNFGCGSSREYAPKALYLRGIRAIFARSFARIFYRNAWNLGLPLIEADVTSLEDGTLCEVDLEANLLRTEHTTVSFQPPSELAIEVWNAGGTLGYLKQYGHLPGALE